MKGDTHCICAQCGKTYPITAEKAELFLKVRRWMCGNCMMENLEKFLGHPIPDEQTDQPTPSHE